MLPRVTPLLRLGTRAGLRRARHHRLRGTCIPHPLSQVISTLAGARTNTTAAPRLVWRGLPPSRCRWWPSGTRTTTSAKRSTLPSSRRHAHEHSRAAAAYPRLRKYSEQQCELCVQTVIFLYLTSGPLSERALKGRRGGAAPPTAASRRALSLPRARASKRRDRRQTCAGLGPGARACIPYPA